MRLAARGLARQKLLDFGGNLGGLNLNSLVIEMDVVAVVFGMTAHRCVEIIGRDFLRTGDFRGNGVASRDAFIRIFHLPVEDHGFVLTDWSCGGPNQPRLRRVSANYFEKFWERLPVLRLT